MLIVLFLIYVFLVISSLEIPFQFLSVFPNKNNFYPLFVSVVSEQQQQLRCFPTKDMQTPPPLRSGHLEIKDAQFAENKEIGVKFHVTS